MKERADPNETPKPAIYKGGNRKISKRWMKVGSGTHPNGLKQFNESVEAIYHRILKIVKEQYIEPGTIYFERDYKYDFSDPFALHSFTSDQFYFYLECDFLF